MSIPIVLTVLAVLLGYWLRRVRRKGESPEGQEVGRWQGIHIPREKLNRTTDRNLLGRELEREGKEEEARLLYEANLAEGDIGSHPYERLRIIYSRRKQYEEALRVCEAFLKVPQEPKKLEAFRQHAEKLRLKIDKEGAR
ncbi:MAG: hypothetical protein GHCLOJNM_03300 [bacterium]|nr:hypothetical protein [bacterium]